MSPLCPECHKELDEDFGIATCSSCGAICFIDLEGNAIVKGDDDADKIELQEDDPAEFTDDDDGDSTNSTEDQIKDTQTDEDKTLSAQEDKELSEFDSSPGENEFYTELEGSSSESEALETDLYDENEIEASDDQILEDLNEDSEPFTSTSPMTDSMSGAQFFKDLKIFTQEHNAEDYGHSFYVLSLTGIETKRDLSRVVELLADERVGIDESDIFEKWLSKDHKKIMVPKLSFLRLVYLHKRLSTLGFLNIDWHLSEDQEPDRPLEDLGENDQFEEGVEGDDQFNVQDSEDLEDYE